MDNKKILVIGAHPDDADLHCGGSTIKWIENGFEVIFMSLTNGNVGHMTMKPDKLAERRYKETQEVSKSLGIDYVVWKDINDGELVANLKNRKRLILEIRNIRPNMIITNRVYDYHADHRNTALLVQDSAHLLGIPNLYPEAKALDYKPYILYFDDRFKKPYPFEPHIFVSIDDVVEQKVENLALHESQLFELLPKLKSLENKVPKSEGERMKWLKENWTKLYNSGQIQGYLRSLYPDKSKPDYVEAYEVSEFGAQLTEELAYQIFPFGRFRF